MITQSDLASAAAVAREVDLTTFGRETGRPSRRTMWITTDALGRIHIRSGQGPHATGLGTCLPIHVQCFISTGGTSQSGRGTSPIVRRFARATAPSSRNMAGSYLPLNQAKR